jgi:hypothetical protein
MGCLRILKPVFLFPLAKLGHFFVKSKVKGSNILRGVTIVTMMVAALAILHPKK